MLLYPRKSPFLSVHKNTYKGIKYQLPNINNLGLIILKKTILTASVIEAIRRSIIQKTKKTGRLIIHVFPHTPILEHTLGSRMGGGKGSFKQWALHVFPGTLVCELNHINIQLGMKALRAAAFKIPVSTKIIF